MTKTAQILLVGFLSIALNSCSALAMGRRQSCDPPNLPIRPIQILCIEGDGGIGQCFNPSTGLNEVRKMKNYVCTPAEDHQSQEEWIDSITRTLYQ